MVKHNLDFQIGVTFEKAAVMQIRGNLEPLYTNLMGLSQSERYVCKNCFRGIKIKKKPPINESESEQKIRKFYCEICGKENNYSNIY